MNDKIIISTISKIHFIIVSFLIFIFLSFSSIFIILQNGVAIQDLSVPHLKIKKLYLKWNEKLNITAQEIDIIKEKKQNTKIDYKQINKMLKSIALFDDWFEKVDIEKIKFNDINGSFKYIYGENGYLKISSDNFLLKSSLFFNSGLFNARIDEFKEFNKKITITGDIIINNHPLELISALKVNINNDIHLKANAQISEQKLIYSFKSLKNVKNIKHTIELFNFSDELRYWVYDAIKIQNAKIDNAYGWIDYKKLNKAYRNLHVKATVNKLNYTYDRKLDSVKSKTTDLIFNDGVLYIKPKQAYTYGFYLGKSWLKIDFTKKEELLSLYLLFDGKVNKDLLYLLKHYEIDLPLLQNSGKVKTDLTLLINLMTIDIDAKGTFYTKKANFKYLSLDIDVFNATVILNNSHVKIDNMLAKYQDIATAYVDLDLDAKNTQGQINFRTNDIKFKDANLHLKKQKKPLEIIYTISPKQDILSVEKSIWKLQDKELYVDAIEIPFDIEKLYANIPTTLAKIPNISSSYISGEIFLKPLKVNIEADVLDFDFDNIKMNQSNAHIKLNYDKKLSIKLDEQIRFKISDVDFILDKTLIEYNKDILDIKESQLDLEDIVKTRFNGKYNIKKHSSLIDLRNIEFKDKNIGKVFSNHENIQLKIFSEKGKMDIDIEKLFLHFSITDETWKLKINSINVLSKKSKILRDNGLTNGNLILFKNINENNYRFSSHIKYPYEILVEKNVPTDHYHIVGKVDATTNVATLKVNNLVDIKIDDNINISAKNIGINLNAIKKYFNNKPSSDANTTKKADMKNIIINAKDSYLYVSKNRHILSDKIKLQYYNDILTAQLVHKKGKAGFKYENDRFHLYGEKFSDQFMQNIFALSKFKDGDFAFSIDGTLDEYSGMFHISKTTVLEYKMLNNILAFINTIPSLVTFSLPGYSAHGLDIKNAYANFHFKDDIYDISNIKVDSDEIKIEGKGDASLKNNTIDLRLKLKTDLGSSLSKVPIVGYIILGKDSVSTNISVTGKLDDPEIKSLIATDIISAPVNIIKRTLMLPFNIFSSDDDDKKSDDSSKENDDLDEDEDDEDM